MQLPYMIGITGGIGSGKSTICRILSAAGIPVYDTDTRAKQLYDTDARLRSDMIALFGDDIYISEGINRSRLASILFSDSKMLAHVSALVHPAVRRDIRSWHQQLIGHSICVLESALLLSSPELRELSDMVVVVIAEEETRIARAMQRDESTRSAVEARICQQMPQTDMVTQADFVIVNDATNPLLPQVMKLLEEVTRTAGSK